MSKEGNKGQTPKLIEKAYDKKKIKAKTKKQQKKKENKVNIYKLTFNIKNNFIFITIICFN